MKLAWLRNRIPEYLESQVLLIKVQAPTIKEWEKLCVFPLHKQRDQCPTMRTI